MTELRYEVLVNDGVRRKRTQRLPDGSPIVSSPPRPREFYDQMIDLYPDRLNVGPVWYGAEGLLS